jgi:hypothetical protein
LDMIFPYISLSIRLLSFVLFYLSSRFPSSEGLSWGEESCLRHGDTF